MAAGAPYRLARRGPLWLSAAIGVGLGALACGGSGSGGDTAPVSTAAAETTEDTGLPPCRDIGRTVVVSVFGAATSEGADEALAWVADPGAEPEARPNVSVLAGAYRNAGYRILYVAMVPSETFVGQQPIVDAVTVWLGVNGFPVGEGVAVWAPDGDGSVDPSVALIEEMTRMRAAGTQFDAGYAGDRATVFPMVTGGVPGERVYELGAVGDAPSEAGVSSTPLPDGDVAAHLAEIASRERICE